MGTFALSGWYSVAPGKPEIKLGDKDAHMSQGPSPWNTAQPSSKIVQHAFTNARVNEINREAANLRNATIQAFLQDPLLGPRLKGNTSAKKRAYCEDAYESLTRTLQSRHLTINFKSASWFTTENPYDSYAQMYERGIKGGKMILDDSDPNNLANVRVGADDRVTFPAQWAGAQPVIQRGQQGAATLTPRGPAPQQIMGRMMAGKSLVPAGKIPKNVLNPVTVNGKVVGYESTNVRFDPRSKQVFAALDYGRRPHGASTKYGDSYLILSESFKADAIYFPEDTFYIGSANAQVSYQTLGAIFLKAKPTMRTEIIKSCFNDARLGDSSDGAELMEAHIFKPVRFADGVSAMVLEPSGFEVVQNAKKFCRRWGINLTAPGGFEFKGK